MNLAKGTRVRLIKPLRKSDEIGDIYTVKNADDTSITVIRSREYDIEDFLNVTFGIGVTGYCVSQQEFAEHFEVIGMEKFKKESGDKVIVGDYTETELDELWKLAGSYEALKVLLKLGVKWHPSKQPKKQRQWTPWKIHPITGLPFSVSHQDGKSSKVKVKCGAFVGIASCNPEDDWDIDLGIKLAAARAEVKRTKALANEKMENLRSIMRHIYGKAAK